MQKRLLAFVILASACAQPEHTAIVRQAQIIQPYANAAVVSSTTFWPTSEPHGAFANSRTLVGGMNGGGGARSWFVASATTNTVTVTRVCGVSFGGSAG